MKRLYIYFFICTSIVSSSLIVSSTMIENSVHAVVLAAGSSTRFKTGTSKLLAPICGQSMVLYPIMLLESLNIPTTVVIGYQRDKIVDTIGQKTYKPHFIVQEEQLGTGHALLCTQKNWNAEHILLLNGDMPLISEDIIKELINKHNEKNAAISFIVSHNTDQSIGYGRIVHDDNIIRIIEAKHFTHKPEDYPLVNAGIYLINRAFLEKYLNTIEQNKVTQEFYVTDLVELASKNNLTALYLEFPFATLHGVNTLTQLEKAERIKKKEITENWMKQGVRFENPKSIHIDLDVTIAPGTSIGSSVELRGKTHIGKNCTIGPFTILNNVHVKDNTHIGSHCSIENKTIATTTKSYSHS